MNQYQETPCNCYDCECNDLDKLLSDEKALELKNGPKTVSIDYSRICSDPNDIKIFIWGYYTDGSAIWTCDKGLLSLCRQHDISRCCFKAAFRLLDEKMNNEYTKSGDYETDIMSVGDDPFFHYSTNCRCATHCGLEDTCICHQ